MMIDNEKDKKVLEEIETALESGDIQEVKKVQAKQKAKPNKKTTLAKAREEEEQRDIFFTELLSRHGKQKVYHSEQIAKIMGITHKGVIEKIRKLSPKTDEEREFVNNNYIGRAYNDEANNRKVYYDITKQGTMLLMLKTQDDTFRYKLIEKLMSFL